MYLTFFVVRYRRSGAWKSHHHNLFGFALLKDQVKPLANNIRATHCHTAALLLANLFNILISCLVYKNVQKWWEILISDSKSPG